MGGLNHHYRDITDQLGSKPPWWDEHAVPRYCDFSPDETANIYACEVCLLGIECQSCGEHFKVCMSVGDMAFGPEGLTDVRGALARSILDGSIHYGDPPNNGCCPAGPTMNSDPRRVLEFWRKDSRHEWERVEDLERDIDCEWAERA